MGRVQLRRLPEILRRRRELARAYDEALAGIPGLLTPDVPVWARTNYQSYAVRVTAEYPLSRDELMNVLLEQGVSTRRGIMNAHQEGAYRDLPTAPLPRSEEARDGVVLLPLYADLAAEEQTHIVHCLGAAGKVRVPALAAG
jgi:dTDP-4-amino-4,6-dideoxygalactose transaminase